MGVNFIVPSAISGHVVVAVPTATTTTPSPPAKRARTSATVPCYRDVDVNTWKTKVKGKNSFGSPTILIFGHDGMPWVAMSHRDEPRGSFPFKLDLEPANGAQIPSFISGKTSEKITEGLDMQISLLPAQIAFLESMDAWIQKEAVLNSKEWFGKTYNATEIAAMYSPVLKKDKEERYPAKLKAKINFTGPVELLTAVTYIPAGGGTSHARSGSGWDFVKPFLGTNGWRGNEVRAVVDFRRVWVVGKKFGISAVYPRLVVVEKETKQDQ